MCTDLCDDSSHICEISDDQPSCTEKQCNCENGVGAVGADCPNQGDDLCASCNDDYDLENGECTQSTPVPSNEVFTLNKPTSYSMCSDQDWEKQWEHVAECGSDPQEQQKIDMIQCAV